jgi:hypothetical protein
MGKRTEALEADQDIRFPPRSLYRIETDDRNSTLLFDAATDK